MMNEWIISSSILIAAVLLGRFLLRGKISLRLQYALWAVVLVRLLVPLQLFPSDFSAASIADEVDISEPIRQVYVSANEDRYEREYATAYRQAAAQYEAADRHVDPVVIEKTAQEQAETVMELDLRRFLYHLWFAGMVVMTSVIVSCNVHLALQLKRRRWALDVPECLLPVYVTEAVPTPCVFGVFRPAIYLTPEAAKGEQVRRHVLEHELTHYRHCDHIWSVLRSLCLVLHWYNPLVWIAAKVSRADAELACDEGALARLGEDQRGDYGRTLIGLTCSAPISDLLLTATTMTGSAGSIRERIKLLMKRPRNTVLALIAVLLVGTIVVGCTFTAAPETTQPTESTDPDVDNDMSYRDEDLPIPEIPEDIFNDEGVLVYPGVEWFMTEDEVMAVLGITHVRFLEYKKTIGEGLTASYFCVNLSDAFGVSMILDFTFRSFWPGEDPVLTEVYGSFVNPADFEAVRSIYSYALGETDIKMTPGIEERWDGDVTFQELYGKEGYEILSRCAESGDDALNTPASYVKWVDVDNDDPSISWFTELPIPEDPASTITPIQPVIEGYAPSMQEALEVYADRNPRELTDAELDQIHEAFKATIYDEKRDITITNPITAFFTSYYDDVRKLDLREFLRYFPTSGSAKETEFQQLKNQYGKEFAFADCETLAQMPVPVHCYRISYIDEILRKYANLPFQELIYKDAEYHLESTDCYYNFTSDFGPGMFPCTEGFVYDGGAILYTDYAALYLEEIAGNYIITAHLPSRNLDPRKEAIAETLGAFFLAYEENINLNRDHSYDHLTVLAADPERTVTHQGKNVPLSDFHGSIEYLHGKEAYWRHVRRDSGILPDTFQVTSRIEDIAYDGDTAFVVAHDHVSFYYEGLGAPSGMGADFEILMVRVDDQWLIADIFERNDWFDADYKDDPNFDPEALIASVID